MAHAEYDGLTGDQLAARLGLSLVDVRERTTSTMDDAHALAAAGAAAGALVVANEQTAGRGRSGARWIGEPGRSLLFTLIERPPTTDGLGVMSLRIGLGVARAVESIAPVTLRLKWPNDIYMNDAKLAGILVEARWRDERLEWVALAMGLNFSAPPEVPGATGLPSGVTRVGVLDAVVPAMRAAAAARGSLTDAELGEWRARDWLLGRRVAAPALGTAAGVSADGSLVIESPSSTVSVRFGSVVLL